MTLHEAEPDHDLLDEIRENRIFATTEWQEIRDEAKKDRLCVAGQVWEAVDSKGRKEREDVKRPALNLDEIGQYINQTVNDVRANPRAVRYAPTGNGANDAGAEFYMNHVREIEYRSHAKVADATAFENAVTASYGWERITTRREHVRSFNQDLYVEPIMNPDQVLADPNAVWPDSRDMRFLYYLEPWTKQEFTRRYPRKKATSFAPELLRLYPTWIQAKTITVGEAWRLETVSRKLVAYRPTGAAEGSEQIALLDELPDGKLPAGMENVREDAVDDTRVKCHITNGIEILEEKKWLGKHIPFISCFGKILYVDEGSGSRRKLVSMTRLARDPAMLYCYIRTCEAEAIGAVPRNSWIGYEGQFAKPQKWADANQKPVPFLEAKVTVPGNPVNSPLPLPQRQPWDPPLQNLEIAAEAARRAIQAAMGITPLPTPLQRDSQKSGKALERIEASGQRGSFHFVDHYELMIERRGVILEDLMDKYLDSARDVPVREPDDSATIVRINDPQGSQYDKQRKLSGDPLFTKGDYRVTVSTGPATESQRDEAQGFVDALVTNLAQLAQMAGPQIALKVFAKSVKLKQLGPIGDDIIELLDPPQLGEDGQPLPPQVARLLGENQQLKQVLQQASQEKQAKVVEQQGKFAIAKMQEDAQTDRAGADREVKLAVAELAAKVKDLQLFYEERARLGVQEHDATQAALERIHQALEAAKDRTHDRLSADAAHQQALEQGDQAVGGQLAVQAAAPQPDNGAGA